MYMCQVYAIELGFCSAAPFPLSPLDLNLDLPWEILLDLNLDLMWEIVLVPTILYDTMSVSSVKCHQAAKHSKRKCQYSNTMHMYESQCISIETRWTQKPRSGRSQMMNERDLT